MGLGDAHCEDLFIQHVSVLFCQLGSPCVRVVCTLPQGKSHSGEGAR